MAMAGQNSSKAGESEREDVGDGRESLVFPEETPPEPTIEPERSELETTAEGVTTVWTEGGEGGEVNEGAMQPLNDPPPLMTHNCYA